MGCCIFVVGGTGDWATFETLGPTIDRIAALSKPIPVEVPTAEVTVTEMPTDLAALLQEAHALDEQMGRLEALVDAVIRKLAG